MNATANVYPSKEKPSLFADYLTRQELAAALGITLRTLANYEISGKAPPSVEIGGKRRYRNVAIDTWLASQERSTRPLRKPRPPRRVR